MNFDTQHILPLVLAAAVAALLVRTRVLRDGLEEAPHRRTAFTIADLCVGVGLWIFGQAITGVFAAQLYDVGQPGVSPLDQLKFAVFAQTGGLLAVVYICVRAHASPGTLTEWGVGVRRPLRTIVTTLLGFGAIVLILGGVDAVLHYVTTALGQPEPPAVGHFMIEYLLNDPPPAFVWGIVLSAGLIAPVVEEVLFRGLIQSTLRQDNVLGTPWAAIVVTSLVFAAVHVGAVTVNEKSPDAPPVVAQIDTRVLAQRDAAVETHSDASPTTQPADGPSQDASGEQPTRTRFVWQSLVLLFVLSLGMGFVYEYTGSLWAPVVVHMMFNGLNIAVALAGVLDQA